MKTYKIIRNIIPKEICKFLENYFLEKEKVAKVYLESQFISRFNKEYGAFNDPQVSNCYYIYGSMAGDIVLKQLKPKIEKITKTKLYETYSFVRVYNKGNELKKHKDRSSCKISTTINLGGETWPIFIQTDPNQGSKMNEDGTKVPYTAGTKKGNKVILNPGDMLLYKGFHLEHWREPLKKGKCVQLFLHYVNVKDANAEELKYDGRHMLGADALLRRKINNNLKKD
tara:strand:+ start:2548 stop:3228 length:681 start_codon:yes stop_codon:yes gene_type:complete